MSQWIIFLTGAPAALLSQMAGAEWQRWAAPLALLGQPFWLAAFYRARQWGMLASAACYTAIWLFGLYTFWIK